MQETDTLASVAAALDAMDPLDQPTMGLNDLETVAELDAWRPGMLWCPDTLRLLEPTPWDTYRELPPSALQAALAGLNAGRRAWALAQLAAARDAGDDARARAAGRYLRHVDAAGMSGRLAGAARVFEATHEVPESALNAEPTALATPAGVLDLETGRNWSEEDGDTRDAVREWRMTKMCRADPREEPDPRWREFVLEICCGDVARADYLQRALGYSCLGANPEECMFVAYGPTTRNGKGTLLNSVAWALGDYAVAADPSLLLERRGGGGGPDEALASLAGARLVTLSEPPEGRRLDEARVKSLTGNDPQSCSRKYGRQFTFEPQLTMWMACNRLPEVADTSVFASGRLRVVPFEAHFAPSAQDRGLKARFRTPAGMAAVLEWLVEGHGKWMERGLEEPPDVRAATEAWAETGGGPLRRFVDEACVPGVGLRTPTSELHAAYREWCAERGETPASARAVARELAAMAVARTKSHGTMTYVGVALRDGRGGQERAPEDAPTCPAGGERAPGTVANGRLRLA